MSKKESQLYKKDIDNFLEKSKSDKTYSKNGIQVERDSQNRVVGLKAKNASRKQIKKIHKMQRSINRKGDY